ncbi:MAG: hypothetical protein P4L50_21660 [Anaerolineaceae bacterium]|nr:hypothetical protein [Anaerolineaceae bacterium]
MSVIEKIAFYQNRRDEVPNQELARELALSKDSRGIQEICDNLINKNPDIQSDCLKVLYEIGYLYPELVASYAKDFLGLLKSKNNRLVWGAMIALSTIVEINPQEIGEAVEDIKKCMENGSVITVDNGVKILADLAAQSTPQSNAIFAYLINHLSSCRPKEIPQHAEKTLVAVNAENKNEFIQVLQSRMDLLTPAQLTRINKVIKVAEKR